MVIRITIVVAGINVVDQQEAGPDDGGEGRQPRDSGLHLDENVNCFQKTKFEVLNLSKEKIALFVYFLSQSADVLLTFFFSSFRLVLFQKLNNFVLFSKRSSLRKPTADDLLTFFSLTLD